MRTALRLLLALTILFPLWGAAGGTRAASLGSVLPQQPVPPESRARFLLGQLTPQEKVGQLVLITFQGQSVGPDTPVYDLITRYHIGGVVLLARNNNIIGPENTLESTQRLVSQLQQNSWVASTQPSFDPYTEQNYTPHYIPLFVATAQEGDGAPYSQILHGLSPLPNQMALGATWNPDLAQQTGAVLGKELAALGINMLLGPSLDVLESPNPGVPGDLGTRTFGGDPFWVGVMGQAFTRGVHQGSSGRLAVVGKYFPGRGSSDRAPDAEVATIRKTLEQLRQIELAPFFAVTGNAPNPQSQVDALLTSHIRYQGLQGNIRATTRPISFDPQAFSQLMALPALQVWRDQGGLTVSDSLGSQAVRRFYDPTGVNFNARLVARDALLAGNDLLYLGDFQGTDDPDAYTTIVRTLEFFTQKYREDPAFAQRVDEAVLRILTLKYRLYSDFNLSLVIPDSKALDDVGQDTQTGFEVARQASTLISPDADALETVLSRPPQLSERIVFFTDSYDVQQCSVCPEEPVLAVDAMQKAVLRLYGPATGGQVQPRNLLSYSFENLVAMLDLGPGKTEVEYRLRSAQWLVFLMLDVNPERPASQALRRLLNERPELLRDKRVIVFALNAPYYLDATDISKITAYYGLYSKGPQFVEVAARLLFNEIRPLPGALPVSVYGVGYDLIQATAPDPAQTVGIYLDLPPTGGEPQSSAENLTQINLRVGDLLPVRTGVIKDHNGHPVPDGTPVEFVLQYSGENAPAPKTVTVNTVNGVARTTFPIEGLGTISVDMRTEPAVATTPLQVDVAGERPTETPQPTLTAQPTATMQPSPTPTLYPASIRPAPTPEENNLANLGGWLLAVALGLFVSWTAYRMTLNEGQVRWSMRAGLAALIGGLVCYIYAVIPLPGGMWLREHAGLFAGTLAMLLGNGLGLWGVWWWRNQESSRLLEHGNNQTEEK
ncbi:MAG: hypothetical protein D6755_10490 [Anaerolineae bacterium]|nr:MAG: hypothetical protein D6755_10490 [Anaerolineae bacterium]